MSLKKSHKPGSKELKKLLRMLARADVCGLEVDRYTGEQRCFRVRIRDNRGQSGVFRPDTALVEYCLAEDLLEKHGSVWRLAENGRLALRRMLAGADPFVAQHQQRRFRKHQTDDGNQTVLINDCSSPLGWLARRRDSNGQPLISKTAFAAGERLARDFQYAGLMPRITSSWTGPGISGQRRSAPGAGMEMSDNRLAARQRVRNAISEVGHELGDLLVDICCFQVGLSDVEAKRGWPRRSGKVILQIALDRLADHYGMSPKTVRQDSLSRITHWGAEGYKPVS